MGEEPLCSRLPSPENTRMGSRFSGLMQRKELSDFFPYETLIEMKIKAFDLLENPKIYRIDVNNHRIESFSMTTQGSIIIQ